MVIHIQPNATLPVTGASPRIIWCTTSGDEFTIVLLRLTIWKMRWQFFMLFKIPPELPVWLELLSLFKWLSIIWIIILYNADNLYVRICPGYCSTLHTKPNTQTPRELSHTVLSLCHLFVASWLALRLCKKNVQMSGQYDAICTCFIISNWFLEAFAMSLPHKLSSHLFKTERNLQTNIHSNTPLFMWRQRESNGYTGVILFFLGGGYRRINEVEGPFSNNPSRVEYPAFENFWDNCCKESDCCLGSHWSEEQQSHQGRLPTSRAHGKWRKRAWAAQLPSPKPRTGSDASGQASLAFVSRVCPWQHCEVLQVVQQSTPLHECKLAPRRTLVWQKGFWYPEQQDLSGFRDFLGPPPLLCEPSVVEVARSAPPHQPSQPSRPSRRRGGG